MRKPLLLLVGALTAISGAGQEREIRQNPHDHRQPGFLRTAGEPTHTYPVHPANFPSQVLKASENQRVLDSLTEYRWSGASVSYELDYRAYYEYNEDGLIVEWRDVVWNSDEEAWEVDDRETYTYNGNGDLERFIFYEIDESSDGEWYGSWKKEYAYANGRLAETVQSQKRDMQDSWYFTWKRVFQYDDMDRVTGTREYIHTLFWKETWRTEREYDENGNLVTITDFDDSDTEPGTWENAVRIDYEYDANDRLILYQRYEWDEESEQWLPDDREEATILANGDVESYVDLDWDDSANDWVLSWKRENTYDQDVGYEQLVLPWFFHDDRPNFMNHLLSEFYIYLYDGGEWENYYRGEYHFSGVGPVGLSPAGTETDLEFYPNPADTEISFVLEEPGRPYHLEVFDLTGKRVQAERIVSGQRVDISTLSAGIYLFRVSGSHAGNVGSARIVVE